MVAIPALGTLTARGHAGGDTEGLGGETNGSLDSKILVLGTLEKLRNNCNKDISLARKAWRIAQGEARICSTGQTVFLA